MNCCEDNFARLVSLPSGEFFYLLFAHLWTPVALLSKILKPMSCETLQELLPDPIQFRNLWNPSAKTEDFFMLWLIPYVTFYKPWAYILELHKGFRMGLLNRRAYIWEGLYKRTKKNVSKWATHTAVLITNTLFSVLVFNLDFKKCHRNKSISLF